ncbi:SPOR domain-containing protein [Crenothrix polyspora]|uniref:Sporulation-like protein n=1 Tax=Crenothrix polyspora TaxID=360316 RepID=A0A1R4H179_9GAMM|nr:SPOR domain-containing protein [Crenothrix polyspora]SJM89810.1 Sporulation-like protein [Crenothrix polyspora]
MDHELKQRLIGAIVVTALAAIFLPMVFDDPVENNGQQVSELTLPKPPEKTAEKELPADFGRALTPDQDITTDTANSNTGDKNNLPNDEEQGQALDSGAEEELIVTEDTPSASKTKPSVDSLDTGDILEAEPTHAPKHGSVKSKATESGDTHTVTTTTVKKKPKPVIETENHKTIKPIDDDITTDTSHKSKPTPVKTVPGLGRWSIQAGSFSKKENAIALLEKLQKQGFPVILQTKGDIYRLKIGPELDKQRASDMKKKLDKQNIQSLMIAE